MDDPRSFKICVITIIIVFLLVLYFVVTPFSQTEGFTTDVATVADQMIIRPPYLAERTDPIYTQEVIQRKDFEINKLRSQVQKLAEIVDGNEDEMLPRTFYRRKLSNKYYPVAPALTGQDNFLNLNDDDFSNKTLSTIKFLSQTRQSKYFGSEVHYPTELCDNFCETEDHNAALNEQVDLVRPVQAASIIPIVK